MLLWNACGAIPPLSQCVFMAFCLIKKGYGFVAFHIIKYRDNFAIMES
jgi:hypothetical protein